MINNLINFLLFCIFIACGFLYMGSLWPAFDLKKLEKIPFKIPFRNRDGAKSNGTEREVENPQTLSYQRFAGLAGANENRSGAIQIRVSPPTKRQPQAMPVE